MSEKSRVLRMPRALSPTKGVGKPLKAVILAGPWTCPYGLIPYRKQACPAAGSKQEFYLFSLPLAAAGVPVGPAYISSLASYSIVIDWGRPRTLIIINRIS